MVRNSQRKKLFAGRDKSWMQFNSRVLEEAMDATNPVLERVKFLAITGSNLDEYVEIRAGGACCSEQRTGIRSWGMTGCRRRTRWRF